ncbi:MerR family transcriptional regulator [Pseudonocardia oceani]|uniref:MerR family transcriptional regulator n=1 Tax=Pseudonocardia oceani TaxID=2792013 RepID=UPI001CF700C3|nr:MerR family transcriptional regulator [Pseudonocardia oceani]
MTTLWSIGEFATVTHLSIRTLRRYHESGLLEPRHVDPHSGYRYYTPDQIPTAQVIRRFRDLDMPVREVARLLATGDVDERSTIVTGHLARLEEQLATTGRAVAALRRLLAPEPPSIEVVHRREPARRVVGTSEEVDLDDVLDWYAHASADIESALTAAGAITTGPPGGLYDNALFTHGHGRATVFSPADRAVDAGRISMIELPARELALTVHRGEHDDIDLTYGALGAHLAEHALVVDGPVHETYLVGPRDTDDRAAWRTEIGWPVFTTAP